MRHHNQVRQPSLVGYNNVRLPPDDHGKAGRGFVSVWSRLGHSQTVLGRQPIEQVAYGAFLISVGSRVDTARCARHIRATMTAVENVAAAVVASCKGSRIFRIAISSTPRQALAI